MSIASIYVLFCFLWVSPTYNHALYVSVIDVEQDENSKKCEVILKVFSDDLQNSIRNFSSEYQQYPTESFVKPNQNLIEKYFNTYIEIRINGEEKTEGTVYRYTNGGGKYGTVIGTSDCSLTTDRKLLII